MCAGYRFSANHEGAFGPTMDMTSLVRGRRTLPTVTASRLEPVRPVSANHHESERILGPNAVGLRLGR